MSIHDINYSMEYFAPFAVPVTQTHAVISRSRALSWFMRNAYLSQMSSALPRSSRCLRDQRQVQLSTAGPPGMYRALLFYSDPQLDCKLSSGELTTALRASRKHTWPGPDHITYAALHSLDSSISKLLVKFFNMLLRAESLPGSWSAAQVVR